MRHLKLNGNYSTIVDDEDYRSLVKFRWYTISSKTSGPYASRSLKVTKNKRVVIMLHRYILELAPWDKRVVDHVNGNTLDNRKENLRIVSRHQNNMNCKGRKHSSKYKGVRFYPPSGKWAAGIRFKSKPIHLGYFDSENEAAKAYNNKSIELFGEFSKPNEIV